MIARMFGLSFSRHEISSHLEISKQNQDITAQKKSFVHILF